jgi:hypothetical protein
MRTATNRTLYLVVGYFFPADFTKRILITDLGPIEKVRGILSRWREKLRNFVRL